MEHIIKTCAFHVFGREVSRIYLVHSGRYNQVLYVVSGKYIERAYTTQWEEVETEGYCLEDLFDYLDVAHDEREQD